MYQILAILEQIEGSSGTIYEVVISLENAMTTLKAVGVRSDRDGKNLQLLETILRLIQKPEQEVASQGNRYIVTSHQSTYNGYVTYSLHDLKLDVDVELDQKGNKAYADEVCHKFNKEDAMGLHDD